jgi:hypothetical protein
VTHTWNNRHQVGPDNKFGKPIPNFLKVFWIQVILKGHIYRIAKIGYVIGSIRMLNVARINEIIHLCCETF